MRLSVCNIAWDNSEDKKMFRLLSGCGFSGIEIAPTRIFSDNPYEYCMEAKSWATELNKKYGLCIPSIQSVLYGKKENIFAGKDDREALKAYTKKAILFAQSIGADNIVFGCPKNRNGYRKGNSELNKRTAIEFFHELGEYAALYNTTIGFEANPPIYHTDFMNTTEESIKFIEEVDSDGFRLNLDIGSLLYYNESMDVLKGKIKKVNHVHISEPGLVKIKRHTLHSEICSLLKDEGYSGFISIEMGCQNNINEVLEAMDYVRGVFSK